MNLWATAHGPIYTFCSTNKPPRAFNLFMTSKRKVTPTKYKVQPKSNYGADS